MSPEEPERPFWPRRQDWVESGWAALLFLSLFLLSIAMPFGLVGLIWVLPEGDTWPVIALNVAILGAVVLIGRYALYPIICSWFEGFRGKVPDRWLDGSEAAESTGSTPPRSVRATMLDRWFLLVLAGFGLAVLLRAIDPDSPWFDFLAELDGKARKVAGIGAFVRWCRDNPNSLNVAMVFLIAVSLGRYGYHVHVAWKHERFGLATDPGRAGAEGSSDREASPSEDQADASSAPSGATDSAHSR